MQIGVVGLGRMGGNIARRLMQGGHQCVVFDRAAEAVADAARAGATAVTDLRALTDALEAPRTGWVMLRAGAPTDETIAALADGILESGDTVIDGGNTFYRDDIRRSKALAAKGI